MPDRFERFSFAMLEIYRHWYTIAQKEMRPWGLSVPHALFLLTMQNFENGITAAQLAEVCGRDKSELSRCIALFERHGLVYREEVNHNQYRALVKLTEDGKKAAAWLRDRADMAVELGGRGISKEKRDVFYEVLELIAYNLQTLSQEGLPEYEPNEGEKT